MPTTPAAQRRCWRSSHRPGSPGRSMPAMPPCTDCARCSPAWRASAGSGMAWPSRCCTRWPGRWARPGAPGTPERRGRRPRRQRPGRQRPMPRAACCASRPALPTVPAVLRGPIRPWPCWPETSRRRRSRRWWRVGRRGGPICCWCRTMAARPPRRRRFWRPSGHALRWCRPGTATASVIRRPRSCSATASATSGCWSPRAAAPPPGRRRSRGGWPASATPTGGTGSIACRHAALAGTVDDAGQWLAQCPVVAPAPGAQLAILWPVRRRPFMQKFDEMYAMLRLAGRAVREHYQRYAQWLDQQPPDLMQARRAEAEMIFRRVGITFAVYGAKDEDGAGSERLIPFDLIPRIIPAHEWSRLQQGLVQRVTALNRFIHDVYHGQDILRAAIVPADLTVGNAQYRPDMVGLDVPQNIYAHIAGIDIVRTPDAQGEYYVLEDNLRVPSGVSYMLENRKMMMRLFPELFSRHKVAPVAHSPDMLLDALRASAPATADEPTVVLLTPGMHNSAYFEHAFLAQQMGVELVEGQDLGVKDGFVYMRTTRGLQRVDVIYRRVDDDYLDPQLFRRDSTLGCHGLMGAYRAGHVGICNAVGTGVADDKSVYPYVPEMIRFYLGQEPILKNVPTWMCRKPADLQYVLARVREWVLKEVHGAGGYGMLIGPAATRAQIEDFRRALQAHPAGYIAQPTLSLSSCPTYVDNGIAPRHIDLRPLVFSGREVQMVAGGLTRVALQEGSLVVNSSQGGGTKDTWVLGQAGTEPC